MTIQGNNKYDLEGTSTNKTWKFKVEDKSSLLTESIVNELKDFQEPIYFNDNNCRHWIFDFKIKNVWFEALNVDCNNMTMVLNAY